MNVNLTPNITGKNVNIIKGATQADLTNSVNNSKTYRDEAEAFSIVSEAKSVEASYSALNASISSTTASDKATIATTKANEASNSAINASASEAVCIAKATIATDKANIATAQSVIATDKANEASVSANAATTQAGIAITKASEASISAINALASENNADTSEANALIYRNQAESFANSINPSDLVHISGTETITGNKTFSGTVSGLTKATVGLSNVDNTSDSSKSVNYATTAGTASANDVYAWAKASVKPTYTASEVGLGNVTNESKATMFTNSTLTGTITLPSTTSIGTISSTELGYIDGVTSNIQTQLDSKNPNLVSGTNIKTINSSTILGSGNINLVDLTTNQSISGIKTFSSSPIVPTPTTGTQAVNKDYVDTGAGAAFVVNDNRVKTALNATGTAPIYACRAWVNFNGTGTVAIRASGNVSSITDNGTGDYTVNFTTVMPDANYNYTFGLRTYQDGYAGYAPAAMQWLSDTQSTSEMRFRTMDSNQPSVNRDFPTVCVSIHR